MGGMKTGAGDDPFADDDGGDERSGERERTAPEPDERADDAATGDRREEATATGGSSASERPASGREGERVQPDELPFIAKRNARGDNIKAGRDKRRLFELRPDVAQKEQAFMTELERRLGTHVAKTDAREAALAVVYDRPELVAEKLEEWGINYFD